MTKLYYRAMAGADNKPKLGRSARLLGVRLEVDVEVVEMPRGWLDELGYLCPVEERQAIGEMVAVVVRGQKGMSTSLSIEALPDFRRPTAFGGLGRDPLWQIDDTQITGDLEAVQDSETHVSIMPRVTMLLERYEAALSATQNNWERVG
jgi:hypothetical protein